MSNDQRPRALSPALCYLSLCLLTLVFPTCLGVVPNLVRRNEGSSFGPSAHQPRTNLRYSKVLTRISRFTKCMGILEAVAPRHWDLWGICPIDVEDNSVYSPKSPRIFRVVK
ncbi:hypothetical protein GGR53DRAFT_320369 [Hypoxylon sp. FL1150]|nr:hypothetical protein GGR53DRAFT_320369 [Hypoxylon sp. FL1150]